jgi:hypothetical protein
MAKRTNARAPLADGGGGLGELSQVTLTIELCVIMRRSENKRVFLYHAIYAEQRTEFKGYCHVSKCVTIDGVWIVNGIYLTLTKR